MHEAKPIEAQLNYLAPVTGKPAYYLYKPGPDVEKRVPENEPRTVPIYDARERDEALSLDSEGVVSVPHQSAVEDFYDEEKVHSVYYAEVEQLVRSVTGASKVLVFDHNVRSGPAAKLKQQGVSMPVRFVHNDYTEKSGPQRVRDLVGDEEAERRLKQRFAVINVWRSIGAPIEDTPLGVCDAGTISGEDCVATDLVYQDRTGEILSFRYNPKHRWYYFPRMHRDEAMLLKCFDSERGIAGRFTAHSAFDNPSAPPDSPARESIEVRTLVFY